MVEDLHFSIDFYKSGNKIKIDNRLSTNEKYKSLGDAIDFVEVLFFFGLNGDMSVLDIDSQDIYRKKLREVIDSFISSARSDIADIENHRQELQLELSKLTVK